MTVETRYFNFDLWTVNGLHCFALRNTNTNTQNSVSASGAGNVKVTFGHRVWKRSIAGVETEITAGIPVAQVSKDIGAPTSITELDATWACPLTNLASTDSIIDRVYIQFGGAGAWTELGSWTTEQLGASSLDVATWTFHCWIQRTYLSVPNLTRGQFYFGSSTYNSRITNFTWTEAVAEKKVIMDGFVFADWV